MEPKDRESSRIPGIAMFVIGIALIADDNTLGWVLLVLGLTYFARSTEQGDDWSSKNPILARVIIIALWVLALLIAVVLVAGKYLGS